MESTLRKRKLVDIPVPTLKNLSIRAVSEGISLKKYIENILIMESQTMTDEEMYALLSQTKKEGKVYLDRASKKNFEKWLEL
ncbi:hypothetical protein FACS1894178_7620 [Bacteroidia bacterium]|nr:hypothetical protein FACS1894178_7620 [Bacteroidia bacterium]